MSYAPLPIVEVKLDDLNLDLDNYRIPTRPSDQAAALAYLFSSEDVLGSARQILRNGYFCHILIRIVGQAAGCMMMQRRFRGCFGSSGRSGVIR